MAQVRLADRSPLLGGCSNRWRWLVFERKSRLKAGEPKKNTRGLPEPSEMRLRSFQRDDYKLEKRLNGAHAMTRPRNNIHQWRRVSVIKRLAVMTVGLCSIVAVIGLVGIQEARASSGFYPYTGETFTYLGNGGVLIENSEGMVATVACPKQKPVDTGNIVNDNRLLLIWDICQGERDANVLGLAKLISLGPQSGTHNNSTAGAILARLSASIMAQRPATSKVSQASGVSTLALSSSTPSRKPA